MDGNEPVTRMKAARLLRGWSIEEVVARVRAEGRSTDRGEVSRLERKLLPLSDEKAAVFGKVLGVAPGNLAEPVETGGLENFGPAAVQTLGATTQRRTNLP